LSISEEWFVPFPSFEDSCQDEAYASLLNTNRVFDSSHMDVKKKAYSFPSSRTGDTEGKGMKKKEKKKLLKKLKSVLRRKHKSKKRADEGSLGIISISQYNEGDSRIKSQKSRFPSLRRKNRKEKGTYAEKGTNVPLNNSFNSYNHDFDNSDDDSGSIVSERIQQVMRDANLHVADISGLDFSFTDSEASDNASYSSGGCGYMNLS